MRFRSLLGRWTAPPAMVALCLCAALSRPAAAAPTLRYQTDLHGDMVVFGNTLGFDCRAGIPDPVVGSVDRSQCFVVPALNTPSFIDDTSGDVFWRCEDSGQVTATNMIQMAQARSAAMLNLPAGATVAYARIYWGSTVREDLTNASSIVIDRPGTGGFSASITAAQSDVQAADRSFQATADITTLVQQNGAGLYRVAGFPKNQLVDRSDDNNYAAWSILVIYKRDSDPNRNFAVYDGLTYISPGGNSTVTIRGFAVPPSGSVDSKLAVIGYEGDHDMMGDAILFKGNRLTDGQPGADSNFFNSSRTNYGQVVTVAGDLPQMSGAQASMNGLDLDVVSITPYLAANDTQAQIDLVTGTTIGSDTYFVGALATAVTSRKPIIDATLTVPQGISPLPGDTVQYTLTIRNVGDDTGTDVAVQHTLPSGLVYVPGSVRVVTGPSQGQKTDKTGDDEVDFDSAAGVLTLRVGSGATATLGGTIKPNDAAIVITYQLQVADTAYGAVGTQAIARATPAGQPGAGPTSYPSGDGTLPNHPTVINVRECMSNYDCTVTAPVCDLTAGPHRCTAACSSDATCQGAPGGKDVCGGAMTCVQCSPTELAACTADGLGTACLATGQCGCMTDADCGGRKCNTTNNTCPAPSADLGVAIGSSDGSATDQSVAVQVHVSSKGPAIAPSGTLVLIQVPAGGTLQSVQGTKGWRCSLSDGAARCTYYRPIGPNTTTPDIQLTIQPAANVSSLTVQASVSSDTSTDPSPGDNTVTKSIDLGSFRVAGGGFGCSLGTDPRGARLWLPGLSALALLGLLSRRRRRSLDGADGAGRSAGSR